MAGSSQAVDACFVWHSRLREIICNLQNTGYTPGLVEKAHARSALGGRTAPKALRENSAKRNRPQGIEITQNREMTDSALSMIS
jgi:hypothetical protein